MREMPENGENTPKGHQNEGRQHNQEDHHRKMMRDFKRRFFGSLVVTVPILALSPTVQAFLGIEFQFPGSLFVLFGISAVVYFWGGYPFLKGLVDEIQDGQPGMMTLISVAITVAFAYSSAVVFGLPGSLFFWELVTLIDIMLLGHWIEMRSVLGASRALEELVKVLPSDAHLVKDGSIEDVSVEELEPGDIVLVRPAEKIPVDGIIVEGASNVNQAMLTGESKPVSKSEGDEVIGGSINQEGSLRIEVQKTGKDTYLNQVVDMVREAQASKSKTQDLANRAAFWLTLISLSVGTFTLASWVLLGANFGFAIERAATVMVITCPHALGLAIPLVVAVSTSLAAKSGLLIRDRQAFERARDIEAVMFDKTGTLTEGSFGVTDIISLGDMSEEELLQKAASIETHSEHLLARGITESAKGRDLPLLDVDDFEAIPGKGVAGVVEGEEIKIISPEYLKELTGGFENEKIESVEQQRKTVVYIVKNKEPIGALALADRIRAESREAIDALKAQGIKCLMLTGDNKHVAEWVAEELGLDDFYAEVLPDEKADQIKKAQEAYGSVAMVGDGVNDAPALAQADVGIAIGAGTDVAVETADIVLVKNDPRDVVDILGLSKRTYSKMIQNLAWATGYNVLAIPLAAGILAGFGVLPGPAFGAIVMSLSTVIVAVNAMRLETPVAHG
ncbi:MAG: copper-translocating P-type ATPase [Candidatus Thorarchaeota archaeon]|nr:copper-translocating P-type ATPase [Candidatus Thorarchaeota archaeon]